MDQYCMSTLKKIGVVAMLLMSAITSILDIHAQPINYFKNLTVEEGLSDNTVKSVIEDEQGFIWIGTFNGLCKYDGNSIKIFRHINGDDKSIIDNHVEALLNVKGGILVGTYQGLNFYDTRTGYFRQALMSTSGKPVSSNIKDLIQIDNKIFALTYSKGLLEMMPDSTFQPTSLYIGEVSGLTECRGNLLMSTRNGLEWIDVKSGRVMGSISIPYKETNDKCIYYDDKEDIVYVGNGIAFGTEAYRMSSEGVFEKINKRLPRNVKAIVRLGDKMVFATDGEGIIMQSDSAEKSITRFNSSLPVDAVHSLYVDRDSNMWIGTYRGGLNLYSKRYSWFQSLSVPEFLKANAVTAIQPFGKDLYIGLDGGGVWRYNPDGNSAVYTSQNSGLPVDNVLEIISDDDCLWLGVYNGGLVKFNPRSNKFDTYKIPSSSYEEDNNHIWDIADDGYGNIYVLCEDLYIFNKSEKNFQLFSQFNRKYPTGIIFDKDTAWISTTNAGLFKIDIKARRILKHYTQKEFMNIRYIYKDKSGFLWLSSENNGIIRFNSSTGKYKSFKPVNGSPNGNVTSIAEDKAGNLWMATTNGLFVYDIADNKFLRFGKEDNIPYSQFNYHSCLNQDSVLYFGAIGGIVRFEPQIMDLKSRKKVCFF